MPEAERPENLSIEEAEKWFNDVYLPKISTLKIAGDGKSHRRKAAWDKAQKPKTAKKKEFIWVPLDYEGSARPGVILYDEDTVYRLELSKYFLQPIIEGLIVIKVGKENKVFLAQIAYDPFALEANEFKLEKSNFTGTLLRADWNDHLIDGTVYSKGKLIKGFVNPANAAANPAKATLKNAKTNQCNYYSVYYQTWEVGSDGVFTVVGHTSWSTVCDGSGNGGWGDSGGGTGGGGGSSSGGTNGGAYYDPLVGSGNGSWVYPTNMLYDFNLTNAINNSTNNDRLNMDVNLARTMTAVKLGADISTWSLLKADAMAKSIGGNLKTAVPLIYRGINVFGYASAIVGAYDVIITLKQGGDLTRDDYVTLAAGAVGITAAVTTGWIAVGWGAVSIGIAVYKVR